MNQTALRAIDPDTHLPFRHQTGMEKMASFLWDKFGVRIALKAAAKLSSVALIAAGTFGYTPSAKEAIGVGVSGLILGIFDFVITAVTRKMGWFPVKSIQVASEEIDAASPIPQITSLKLAEAIRYVDETPAQILPANEPPPP